MTVQTFRSTTPTGEILWKITPGYSQALLNQVRQHLVKIKAKSYLHPTCHPCITWISTIRTACTKVNLTWALIGTLTHWFSQTDSGL
ncbi:5-azacytidine induced gene 2, isoform CRA_a [Rattus norvegicus]|uniref:5-azacytidine induced gene 2, isoform CRA_a n=1 Tax=Rattus norvegicus TaxID=10116 RepID=A6I3T6_RAT|nr:5-azacytidine induced gene 2, isoform CRA_a [Rattus norvegicus]